MKARTHVTIQVLSPKNLHSIRQNCYDLDDVLFLVDEELEETGVPDCDYSIVFHPNYP